MNERSARRLARLSEALAQGGSLRLSEAAALCGVSPMTIRRDLAASEGGLQLMGGHLVRSDDPRYAPVYDLAAQRDRHAAAKRRLCRRALERIAPGDTLFIDCGTTLMPLAASLPRDQSLTVVTYALNVAEVVSGLAGVRLILLGGSITARRAPSPARRWTPPSAGSASTRPSSPPPACTSARA